MSCTRVLTVDSADLPMAGKKLGRNQRFSLQSANRHMQYLDFADNLFILCMIKKTCQYYVLHKGFNSRLCRPSDGWQKNWGATNGSACRAQTDTWTHRRTLPKILPLPLTREVKNWGTTPLGVSHSAWTIYTVLTKSKLTPLKMWISLFL